MKDVVEGPMMGSDVKPVAALVKGSFRDRDEGDMPPFKESREVAGDTPSEILERRLRG